MQKLRLKKLNFLWTNGQSSEKDADYWKSSSANAEKVNVIHTRPQILKSFFCSLLCHFCPESHIFMAESLKLLMRERRHKKDTFSFVSMIYFCHRRISPRTLILLVFGLVWMQAVSPAVMRLALSIVVSMFGAQRGRGGRLLLRLRLRLVNLLDVAPELSDSTWEWKEDAQELGKQEFCCEAK